MKIKNGSTKKAFTLIEMMLVIAVIAVILSVMLMTYRDRSRDFRVEKAAIQMQHVLEAALAYHVDTGAWPQDNTAEECDPSAMGELKTFIANYLPNQDYQSNFGANYCWAQTGTNNRLFWVALEIPKNDFNLASQLAGKLPNAIVTSNLTSSTAVPCETDDDCYVRAEVTQPGLTAVNGLAIQAAGTCLPNQRVNNDGTGCSDTSVGDNTRQTYTIVFPACQTGQQPISIPSPNFTLIPYTTQTALILSSLLTKQLGTCTNTPDQQGHESCAIDSEASVCANYNCSVYKSIKAYSGGQLGANYIVYCSNQRQSLAQWL